MKKLAPNVRGGGKAKPIGSNLYYMSGRKHSQGGIDIGDTLEVEDGEIVQTDKNEVKVFSAQPILNGKSPAKLVMGGANPNKVFNAQEKFKDAVGLNDDGTKKETNMKKLGGNKKSYPTLTGMYHGRNEGKAIKALRSVRNDSNYSYNGNTNFSPNTSTAGMYDSLPIAANARTAIQQTNRRYSNPSATVNNNTVSPIATKPNNKRQSFNDAFATARKSSLDKFDWNGKSYGTQLANSNTSTRKPNELPEVTVTAPRVETLDRELPEVNVNASRLPSMLNQNKYRSGFSLKRCGGKKASGGLVTVNGNVVNKLIGNQSYDSPTGGRKKAALGTKERDKDYVYWNGKLHKVTTDEFGEMAYEPVDDRVPNSALLDGRGATARKSERQVRTAARRDAKKEVENSSLIKGGANFNIEPFKPTGLPKDKPSSTNNKKPNVAKSDNSRQTYRVGNKIYKKGETFDYKGKTYKVEGRNKAVPYSGNNNRNVDQNVRDAAKRDAKGARTDFRDMLETPEFTPIEGTGKTKTSNKDYSNLNTRGAYNAGKAASVSFGNNDVDSNKSADTSKPAASAPRRGSGTVRRSSKSATPTKATPNFANLDSMKAGLPAEFHRAKYAGNSAELPDKLSTNVKSGNSSSKSNVPDVISSPKKRLALFDTLGANDIIGLGANLAGSIASGIHSRKQLDKMEAPKQPNAIIAENMKTSFNINPQLGEVEENSRRMTNDINANTSSSKTRLQRLQRTRNNAQQVKNNLRGQKENIETQLINADKANKQKVNAANVAAKNDWINRTTEFQNSIREQKASSLNNMFSGINAGIQDMVGRIENRRNYKNTLGMYEATHPNVDKRLFKDKGVKF